MVVSGSARQIRSMSRSRSRSRSRKEKEKEQKMEQEKEKEKEKELCQTLSAPVKSRRTEQPEERTPPTAWP